MGYWIDENTYQFEDEREMMKSLGLDPETVEGDYAECYQHLSQFWRQAEIDRRLDKK